MKIPNFRTRQGSELYAVTAGHRIAPLVAEALAERVIATLRADDFAGHLLDVACGPGTLALRLARELPGVRIAGVDASVEMIKRAHGQATEVGLDEGRIRFAAMDVHHLAFEAATFDAATCNLGFPFFAHPVAALAEIGRVLKPGASLWASVPDRASWRELFEVVHEAVPASQRLLRGFMAKLEQAQLLLPSLEQAEFTVTDQELVRLPFTFANGREAVRFFNDLFSLFSALPAPIAGRLSHMLDQRFPRGISTAYVALLARAQRVPDGPRRTG